MKKSVILAEKPSVAKDIARVLKCEKRGAAYENNQYIVTWAYGHLVTLATPERYKKEYETWKMEDLPIIPKEFRLDVMPKTRKHYQQVIGLMQRGDVSDIIIATDAGREGELVARWILEKGQIKKPIKRLWISSVTDQAIKTGFNQLKPGTQYNRLFEAAKARAYADWLVGLNATRGLTCHYQAPLSCGRVQTPTLQLVQTREQAITQFKPMPYYELLCKSQGITFKYQGQGKKGEHLSRILDEPAAKTLGKAIEGQPLKVLSVERKNQESHIQGFYDLTTLQRDANRLYGYSAKETLKYMQSLYDHHKVLTYPRTDANHITTDVVPTLGERLRAVQTGTYKTVVASILKSPIKPHKSFVDNQKVTDHHGIIPTEERANLSDLTPQEKKIYDLVVKRFLAVFMGAYRYEKVSIQAGIKDHKFQATVVVVQALGYKALDQVNVIEDQADDSTTESQQEQVLLKVGDTLNVQETKLLTLMTKPKPRLTEGTLLGLMNQYGLGTVATRADIIEKILNNGYIEKRGQHLHMTKTGEQLLELVPEGLKAVKLTAQWEADLKAIEAGTLNPQVFLKAMTDYAKTSIAEIKASKAKFIPDNVTHEKCPECGTHLLLVDNQYGKKMVCQNRACGYKNQLSKTTNARCPDCHKKMQLVGEGEQQKFVCLCGFKESLAQFEKRKATKKGTMDKRNVQTFLKQQEKKEVFNNPFAHLLEDLKDE